MVASSLIIRTNQQSLRYIQDQKLIEGIQHKLLVKLLGYNFTIEYKQGNKNRVADALSRVKYKLHSLIASSARPTWISEVVDSYQSGQKCKDLITQLATNANALPNYTFQHGVLGYKNIVLIGSSTQLKNKLMAALHNSKLGGHLGHRATYQRVKLLFHWPGMKQDIVSYIK